MSDKPSMLKLTLDASIAAGIETEVRASIALQASEAARAACSNICMFDEENVRIFLESIEYSVKRNPPPPPDLYAFTTVHLPALVKALGECQKLIRPIIEAAATSGVTTGTNLQETVQ